MPFRSSDTEPENLKVSLNVRVTWRQREQLRQEAIDRKISLNQLILDALDLS